MVYVLKNRSFLTPHSLCVVVMPARPKDATLRLPQLELYIVEVQLGFCLCFCRARTPLSYLSPQKRGRGFAVYRSLAQLYLFCRRYSTAACIMPNFTLYRIAGYTVIPSE